MIVYGFEVAHGYKILKGFVHADNEKVAKKKILNQEWDDITDEYDTDILTEGYEIMGIWQ